MFEKFNHTLMDENAGDTGEGGAGGGTPPADPPKTDSWLDSLPEPFRDAPFISKAKTPEEAVNEIKNAASYMGQSIRIPGEDASEEDRKAFYEKIMEKAPGVMPRPTEDNMDEFYKALGRPDNPDDYNVEFDEDDVVPPDFESFSKLAHKYGLSQDQFRGILKDVVADQKVQLETQSAEQKQELKKLSEEWGVAFDQNIGKVKNFLRLTDAPEGIVDLISNGAMSPEEIKWIHSIATQTKSPTELAEQDKNYTAALTPSEARNRIQEMLNNQDHPYWNATDPRHKEAIDKMIEYQRAANPG